MPQNKLIQYIQFLKESQSPELPYFICVDDKIIHASKIVSKILKQDFTGVSIRTFLIGEEREDALKKTKELYSGMTIRRVKLGTQQIMVSFEAQRQQIDEKVVSFILIKKAELIPEDIAC